MEATMTNQAQKAERFQALHIPGNPLVLFNVWDAGSAKAVAASGAHAIATGSWSVANANGFDDGEQLPLRIAIDNLRRIVKITDLPVTMDLESGYGETPAKVGETISLAIEAGAIGCNIEDSFPADGTLRPAADQAERIRAARQAADAANIGFFINARTDVFFQDGADPHDETMMDDVLNRARAYAEAGASGLFVPGLADIALIERIAGASPLPLNIMVGKTTPPLAELARAGVARVSHGPGPYLLAMKALEEAARNAIS
jgi:2-methylisocitrate lyase-like PEP mutase family enzyme